MRHPKLGLVRERGAPLIDRRGVVRLTEVTNRIARMCDWSNPNIPTLGSHAAWHYGNACPYEDVVPALLRGEPDPRRQAPIYNDEVDRLRAALRRVVDEVSAEHYPDRDDDPDPHRANPGCRICWPRDGSWPCVTRLAADDARALLDGTDG